MGIVVLLNLLSIICGKYEEMELIKGLTDCFSFDHHFYLVDSSADTNRYIRTKGLTPQTLYYFTNADNDTKLEYIKVITSKNAFLIVVPETSQFDRNSTFLRWMKKIQPLQINMKIGVFFPQPSSMEDLRAFFEWCKKNLIVNIFATTTSTDIRRSCSESDFQNSRSINIFTFDPFGKFEVINVTSSETYDGFFLSRNSNFQQHQLKLGSELNKRVHGKLWRTVFSIMNASSVYEKNNFTYNEAAAGGVIDLYPEPISQRSLEKLNAYPLEMWSHVIIVPEALPYPEFSTYWKNTTSGELFGYCLISVGALILVLSILRYVKQKKFLLCQSLVDVFCLVMNYNSHIKYQRLSPPEIWVIVPLTFVGLIVTNGILANLNSYLTKPILQPQIKTVEEIYTSPLNVLIFHETWKKIIIEVLTNQTEGKDWSKKILVDQENFDDYLKAFNRTTFFLVSSEFVRTISIAQKLLEIPGYHNPNIVIRNNTLYGFFVIKTFLYFERLNEIIQRLKSSGIYTQWIRIDDYNYAKESLKLKAERNHNEMDIERFEFPMYLFYGWSAGLIVLIMEIVWKRFGLTAKVFCH